MEGQGTVGDVLDAVSDRKPVVQVSATDNFLVCLWQLQKHNVSSCPVWSEAQHDYIGMCDMLDLATFALVTFEDRKILYEQELLQYATGELVKPEYTAEAFCNMSTRNRWAPVTRSTPVAELLRLLGAASGLHRVCVVDEHRKVVGIVSQTDLASYIMLRPAAFRDRLAEQAVGPWAVKPTVSVGPATEAAKAFEMLIDEKVSALPVLDESGRLITSFSGSDLKGAETGQLFKTLQSSVVNFLKTAELRMRPGQAGRRVLTCRVGEGLFDVMGRLVTHRVHRMWVVNDKGVCIGVVAFGDIFDRFK